MARFHGKVLVLLAMMLVLANAGCLARCLVQSCVLQSHQEIPPPCHSHSKGDSGHCPQQNQMKMAAIDALAFHLGIGFVPEDWPLEVTQAGQPCTVTVVVVNPSRNAPAPPPLRI